MGIDGASVRTRVQFTAYPHPIGTMVSLVGVFVFCGIFLQLMPVSAPSMILGWRIDETSVALPMSGVLVGSGIGTIAGGALADIYGRRRLIGLCILSLTLFEALASLAADPLGLLAPMVLAGLAMGGIFSSAIALATELVPLRRRGFVVSLTVAGPPFGLSLCALAAAFILPQYGWSTLFRLAAALGVPVLIAFIYFVPESPAHLSRNPSRRDELERLRTVLGAGDELADRGSASNAARAPLSHRFAQAFRADPSGTLGVWGLFFAIYFFGNAILSWVPVSLTKLGFSLSFASGALTAWTTASIVGTPLAGLLLAKMGLRFMAATSAALCTCVVLSITIIALARISSQPLFLIWLATGGVATAGLVTALLTLVAQTYPSELRASGIGLCDALGRLGGIFSAYFGVYLISFGGPTALFILLTLLMLIVTVYLLFIRSFTTVSRGEATHAE